MQPDEGHVTCRHRRRKNHHRPSPTLHQRHNTHTSSSCRLHPAPHRHLWTATHQLARRYRRVEDIEEELDEDLLLVASEEPTSFAKAEPHKAWRKAMEEEMKPPLPHAHKARHRLRCGVRKSLHGETHDGAPECSEAFTAVHLLNSHLRRRVATRGVQRLRHGWLAKSMIGRAPLAYSSNSEEAL